MLTFKNIRDQVLTFLDLAGDTGHATDLVDYAINSAHEKVLIKDRWNFMLWPTPIAMTFTSNKRNFILHPEAVTLADFRNTTANTPMKETPTRNRYDMGVDEDRYHFEFVNSAPVKAQPSTVGVVAVTGSAHLKYLDANQNVVEEDVTGANTTSSVSEIITVTKLNDSSLTLTDIDANQLLFLSASQYGRSYPQIRLFDDGNGDSGEYRFYRKPSLLVRDNDIPDIPYPFSRRLVFDALLELAQYNDAPVPGYWMEQREDWDRQMRDTFLEGAMEGSEIRRVHETNTFQG